ncbi:hypothetical protein FRX31_024864 [Thalictrum thalictroides]|uniref:Uncharacterized protein n=1 Tax=Thalictrum thalictroides TaxID=46969 RepID=A0A7J6VKA6_THATH|nr:hypothetical protein FRX31_024864 [Thalictrum thalictroides]
MILKSLTTKTMASDVSKNSSEIGVNSRKPPFSRWKLYITIGITIKIFHLANVVSISDSVNAEEAKVYDQEEREQLERNMRERDTTAHGRYSLETYTNVIVRSEEI